MLSLSFSNCHWNYKRIMDHCDNYGEDEKGLEIIDKNHISISVVLHWSFAILE